MEGAASDLDQPSIGLSKRSAVTAIFQRVIPSLNYSLVVTCSTDDFYVVYIAYLSLHGGVCDSVYLHSFN